MSEAAKSEAEITLAFALQALGGELVERHAPGTRGAKLAELDAARAEGRITGQEFEDAVGRLMRSGE